MVTDRSLDVDALAARLGLGDALDAWRETLAASEPFAATAACLPDGAETARLATRFGFRGDVTAALVDAAAGWADPAVRQLAAHAQWRIVERYDPRDLFDVWPVLDGSPDPAVRLLWAGVGLSLVPHVERLHVARGIPAAVTDETMWDLGQQVHEHRLVHGHFGLGVMSYIRHYLAGHLFGAGRLQAQIGFWPFPDHGALRHDDPVIDLHIPETGPLDPAAVDASIVRAATLAHRHYPEHGATVATCTSWLLDPELAQQLPPSSNIVAFQERFTRVPIDLPVPSGAFRFVFHREGIEAADGTVTAADLDALARETRLQRVLADHVRSGGRWRVMPGYLALPRAGTAS